MANTSLPEDFRPNYPEDGCTWGLIGKVDTSPKASITDTIAPRGLLVVPEDDSDYATDFNEVSLDILRSGNAEDITHGAIEALKDGIIRPTVTEKVRALALFSLSRALHVLTKPLSGSVIEVSKPTFIEVQSQTVARSHDVTVY